MSLLGIKDNDKMPPIPTETRVSKATKNEPDMHVFNFQETSNDSFYSSQLELSKTASTLITNMLVERLRMHKAGAAHLPSDYIKAFSDITKVTDMYQKQVDADKEKAGLEQIVINFVKKGDNDFTLEELTSIADGTHKILNNDNNNNNNNDTI